MELLKCRWGFLGGAVVKPIQERQVRFLGEEAPLESEMATDSSILAWKIPWTEELGELQSPRSQRSGHNERLNTDTQMQMRLFFHIMGPITL